MLNVLKVVKSSLLPNKKKKILQFHRKFPLWRFLIQLLQSTKVSFFWDQSQDMSSSGFPPKNQALADISNGPIRGLFFGGKLLELTSWLGSQKKMTLVLFRKYWPEKFLLKVKCNFYLWFLVVPTIIEWWFNWFGISIVRLPT